MGGTRECRCTCDGFAMVLRVFSFLVHAATGVAAGWGFIVARDRWNEEKPGLSPDVAKSLASLNQSFAVFQGLMATYYCLFAILGMLAEIRNKWLRATILKHLTFLTSFFGRGCFMIYTGSVFVTIPWDPNREYVSRTVGGTLLGFGSLQVLFWLFVKKQQRPAGNAAAAAAAAANGSVGAGKPGWPAGDSDASVTPSRQQLLVGSSPIASGGPAAVVNPVHGLSFSGGGDAGGGGAARYESAPVPTDATGVPVRNPFNQ